MEFLDNVITRNRARTSLRKTSSSRNIIFTPYIVNNDPESNIGKIIRVIFEKLGLSS